MPRCDLGVGHSLGLLDLVEVIAADMRRRSGSSLILAFCKAKASDVVAASTPTVSIISSGAGAWHISSSSSVESLSRPAAILAAFLMASSIHASTVTANSMRMRSAYSMILLCRSTASTFALTTFSVSAHNIASPCSCSNVLVLGDCHCITCDIRDSD